MPVNWVNVSAGPRQAKEFNKAVGALRFEGQSRDELYGVTGGKEHGSTVVSMFGPVREEVTALDEAIRARYDGKVTKDNVRAVIADYTAALPEAAKSRPVDDNRRSAEQDAELTASMAAQAAEFEAREAASTALLGQAMAKAPAGAKALIYAELQADTSDIQADYHGNRTERTVAIGFRTGTREDFRQLRAAAGAFPETAHLMTDPDAEYRQNYSQGGGNFLSDHGSANWGSGWIVKSRDFPCKFVNLTEDAVPERPAAPAPAGRQESAAKPAGPRVTAIPPEVLDVLRGATADGNTLRMGTRLDRATYVAVNEVLAAAGGKWNRKAQAHLFEQDAAAVLATLLEEAGVVRPQDEGWFPTPAAVVADMLAMADLTPGTEVLEPSAGEGAIVAAAAAAGCTVDAVERNAKRAGTLYATGAARSVTMADFLAVPQRPAYNAVLMNPPFADKADIAHVRHALGFLAPGGVLVAVMSNGVTFRDDKETAGFREMFTGAGGVFKPLPDDSFKASGTSVRTVLAVLTA